MWRPDLPDFEDHDKDPDNSLPLANKYLDVSILVFLITISIT
jgi:hypothetical protein